MSPKSPIDRTISGLLRLNGQKLFESCRREGLPLTQIPLDHLARTVIVNLEESGLTLSNTDKNLVQKIVFTNIDLRQQENNYHFDIIRSLFQNIHSDGIPHRRKKYIYDIADQLGVQFPRIKEIKIDVIRVQDISLNFGTRRDVDCITLVTDQGEVSFTVSLDKEPFFYESDSHSKQEAQVLIQYQAAPGLWAIQKCFGFVKIQIKGKPRGVVFKEFLPGIMVNNYTSLLEQIIGTPYEDDYKLDLQIVAFSHGRMIGNIYRETGAFPKDMNPLNIIIGEQEGVRCRTCDISGLETDFDKCLQSLLIDIKDTWKTYSYYYLFGFLIELRSSKRQEILEAMKIKFRKKLSDPYLFENLEKSINYVSKMAELILEARGVHDEEARRAIAEVAETVMTYQLPPAGSVLGIRNYFTGEITKISYGPLPITKG